MLLFHNIAAGILTVDGVGIFRWQRQIDTIQPNQTTAYIQAQAVYTIINNSH